MTTFLQHLKQALVDPFDGDNNTQLLLALEPWLPGERRRVLLSDRHKFWLECHDLHPPSVARILSRLPWWLTKELLEHEETHAWLELGTDPLDELVVAGAQQGWLSGVFLLLLPYLAIKTGHPREAIHAYFDGLDYMVSLGEERPRMHEIVGTNHRGQAATVYTLMNHREVAKTMTRLVKAGTITITRVEK